MAGLLTNFRAQNESQLQQEVLRKCAIDTSDLLFHNLAKDVMIMKLLGKRFIVRVAYLSLILITGLLIMIQSSRNPTQNHLMLLVKNAYLVPLDKSGLTYHKGYLSVDSDGIITEVNSGDPPSDLTAQNVYDAKGKIIMPGFVSGHSHLVQSPFRGIASDKNLLGWILGYHRTYEPHYGKDDFHTYALHGALDHLTHGITTAFDWTANANSYTLEKYLQQYHGAVDAGIRLLFGFALDLKLSLDDNRKLVERYLQFMETQKNNPLNLGLSLSGLGTLVGEELASLEFNLAKQFDLPIQVHYLEEPNLEWTQAQQDLFRVFKEREVLGPKLSFAHFINTNDEILTATAKTGAGMIWNPLSNGRLASGLPDIPKYMQYGIKIGMGIDGQASADLADPFENMRMGLYGIRMKYQQADILLPLDMLRLHTIETAKVLNIDDKVGSLEVGKYADFIVLDPKNIETGPIFDIFSHLVFATSSANIARVYVGGELIVKKGIPVKHNYTAIKDDIRRRITEVCERQLVNKEDLSLIPPEESFLIK